MLAGAGQFGRADQGIFAYWVNAWLRKAPLAYIGYGGSGLQVRDCLHPVDLVPLLDRQLDAGPASDAPRVVNVSGGRESARSRRQLSAWCQARLGGRPVEVVTDERPFDIPWLVLDSSRARDQWKWAPQRSTDAILDEILAHAVDHPDWLDVSRHA